MVLYTGALGLEGEAAVIVERVKAESGRADV
jgi:hypothetical protein